MFSGIIEEKGKVVSIKRVSGVVRLSVATQQLGSDCRIGDSIAVNGVCLTVVAMGAKQLSFDVVAQTLKDTTLGVSVAGDFVNLERSLKVGERISGHFVLGHVDGKGVIRKRVVGAQASLAFDIAVPVLSLIHI